jgi:hypothetical protein
MGVTRNILSRKTISDVPTFYSDVVKLEAAESFHFHYRDFRFVFSQAEFEAVSGAFVLAYLDWFSRGKHFSGNPDAFKSLIQVRVDERVGSGFPPVRGDDLCVELQQHADYLHLHYRGFRAEFTIDEFLEFADVMKDAAGKLRAMDGIADCPRRVGKHHIVQARGRVTDSANSGEFWIGDNYIQSDDLKTRKSVVIDDDNGDYVDQTDEEATKRSDNYLLHSAWHAVTHLCFLGLKPAIRFLLGLRCRIIPQTVRIRYDAKICLRAIALALIGRSGLDAAKRLLGMRAQKS